MSRILLRVEFMTQIMELVSEAGFDILRVDRWKYFWLVASRALRSHTI